jgi:chromosome partitioning protein
MAHVITLSNIKGGAGKSTSAIFIADGLAAMGYKVLLIDLDAQINTTYAILREFSEGSEGTIYEVFRELDSKKISEVVRPTNRPNLFIVPGTLMIASTEIELVSATLREFKLRTALKEVEAYFHYVVIDTTPNLGLLTINALVASTDVIIPVTLKAWGLLGIRILLGTITILREKFSPFGISMPILGVLVTQVRKTKNSEERYRQLHELFGERIFKTMIPLNEKIEESNDQDISGYDFAPDAKGIAAYAEAVKEIVSRVGSA